MERQSKGGIGGGLPSPQHRRRAVTHRRRSLEISFESQGAKQRMLLGPALSSNQRENTHFSSSLATGARRFARGVPAVGAIDPASFGKPASLDFARSQP